MLPCHFGFRQVHLGAEEIVRHGLQLDVGDTETFLGDVPVSQRIEILNYDADVW